MSQTGGYVRTRREDWKMVVKEAKVLQGLYSHGVVVVVVVFNVDHNGKAVHITRSDCEGF